MGVGAKLNASAGHRERLKQRFLAGDPSARTEAALLELLLFYAVPQRDVRPLAARLLARFGSLRGVVGARASELSDVDGLGRHSVTLLRLVGEIQGSTGGLRNALDSLAVGAEVPVEDPSEDADEVQGDSSDQPVGACPDGAVCQLALFGLQAGGDASGGGKQPHVELPDTVSPKRRVHRPRGDLFSNSMLGEAIEFMPQLPDTQDVEEAERFIREHLHFSSQETRKRAAQYIVRRMFGDGVADAPLRHFARGFAGRQELRDVCFYRLCKAEPLEVRVVNELLIPAMSAGRLERPALKAYLANCFPAARTVRNGSWAIVEALVAGGVAGADRETLTFAYRDILLPSLAFVLHSEYPEPGMYDIGGLETNPVVRAMLWRPDRLLPALYELRNRGLIAKVSEIDSLRQFTTKWGLNGAVAALTSKGGQL